MPWVYLRVQLTACWLPAEDCELFVRLHTSSGMRTDASVPSVHTTFIPQCACMLLELLRTPSAHHFCFVPSFMLLFCAKALVLYHIAKWFLVQAHTGMYTGKRS